MRIQSCRSCVLSLALLVILSACFAPSEDQDRVANEQLIRGAVEFWASKDTGQLGAVYAEDAVLEDVTEGASYEGLDAIKGSLGDDVTYAPDVKVEIVSLFVSAERGALEWLWSGTQTGDIPGLLPATDRTFSVRGVSVFEFENGTIRKQSDYYDAARFLNQLGVEIQLPEMPPDEG
jgi:steroid delta-isomerase-like uncharacterized protein